MKRLPTPLLAFLTGSAFIASSPMGILTWAQGWAYASSQFLRGRWYVMLIIFGFGVQAALYSIAHNPTKDCICMLRQRRNFIFKGALDPSSFQDLTRSIEFAAQNVMSRATFAPRGTTNTRNFQKCALNHRCAMVFIHCAAKKGVEIEKGKGYMSLEIEAFYHQTSAL